MSKATDFPSTESSMVWNGNCVASNVRPARRRRAPPPVSRDRTPAPSWP
ncbi:MAG: hypothetical protein MZV63_23755 [Marinilabiliales bacterium]|nr:hypothetical protein [Marinilabiliales bacterium]